MELPQSLFDTQKCERGLIPRVSNMAVLSCRSASHADAGRVFVKNRGLWQSTSFWGPTARTCRKFPKKSLDKPGVHWCLPLGEVGLDDYAGTDEEEEEHVWLELESKKRRLPGALAIMCNRHVCLPAAWWDGMESLAEESEGERNRGWRWCKTALPSLHRKRAWQRKVQMGFFWLHFC